MKVLLYILLLSCSSKNSNNSQVVNHNSEILQSPTKNEKPAVDSINFGDKINDIKNTIGVIKFNFKEISSLKFFNNDGSIWDSLKLGEAPSAESNLIQPFAISLDYFVLIFKCTREDSNTFEIIVDERNQLKKYINKQKGIVLQNWTTHISEVFAVGFDQETNPLRSIPSVDANVLPKVADEFYMPVQVKGDWVKVKWGEENNWKFGWIKWREKEKLAIELFYYA